MLDFSHGVFQKAKTFTSDSRRVDEFSIFVALKGAQKDGHEFVEEVLKKGAPAAVVSADWSYPPSLASRLIVVTDTHLAHRELAAYFRKKFKGKIIAIGGSSGKTTTKEFLFNVLSQKFRCFKTQQSQNGELGIPKTLEQLSEDWDLGLVEVGIDAPGDMSRHVELLQPDFALLSSIGEEHLEQLKDIDTVFKEEMVLFEATWTRGGFCFAPKEDQYLSRLEHVHLKFSSKEKALAGFQLPIQHPYALQNLGLVVELARHFSLSDSEIQRGINSIYIPEGRGGLLKASDQLWIITDHYNSNPSSLKAGIENALLQAGQLNWPLTAVLGDMLDLGSSTEALHVERLREVLKLPLAELYLVGAQFQKAFEKITSSGNPSFEVHLYPTAAELKKSWNVFSIKGLCFLKGSRGMRLEQLLDV